ncbi:hypothetical protein TRFO_21522 [Tritrichomonas foetus]|uniref:USP domain-containing protein n=1 Tax=Tritrichomonas foetus TaxID=1144522 RepID=A0A1J4KEE6_9EUKA|nr:hypothetical protein TRFO_21522 [Tritrichomonas foetus]|eukprot:OHT09563.1 hypothetical protein TRFO_21522 [Tritrichomonas foetus]
MSDLSQESEFDDFKNNVINMVCQNSVHTSLISQLSGFLKDIYITRKLKPPFDGETDEFLEVFSVNLINKILQTREKNKSIQKPYQSILTNYVRILAKNIVEPYPKFIEAAKIIVTQKSQNFYRMMASYNYGMPPETSQYFYDNVREFVNHNVLETLIKYYSNSDENQLENNKDHNISRSPSKENKIHKIHRDHKETKDEKSQDSKTDNSSSNSLSKKNKTIFNMKKAAQIISIIHPLTKFFEKSQLNDFILALINSYREYIETVSIDELKCLDDNLLNKFNNNLFVMSNSSDLKTKLTVIQISLNIRLVKTMLLRLQFNALASIKSCLNKSYLQTSQMTSYLKKENFLDILLDSHDLHHQLVPDFISIFGYMVKNGDAGINEIRKFWLISTSQHPSVIDYFFKPWYSFFYEFKNTTIDSFFEMVSEEKQFPKEALAFLRKVAFKASPQIREVLFNCLMKMLNDKEFSDNENDTVNLVVDLCCTLVPTNNEKFCLDLQNKCIKLISKNKDIYIALPLLKSSCRKVSSKKAREYFDAVLKSMMKGNVDVSSYFDLLIKILENFEDTFNEKEFKNLKKLVLPLLYTKENFNTVCQFFTNLMKIKNKFATDEMLYEIYLQICQSSSFDIESFNFIKRLYERLRKNSSLCEESQLLDSLWKLFLQNPNSECICEYLISLYEKNSRDFIDKCFENISDKEEGSLTLLEKYIHYIEDGLSLSELGIHQNSFHDPESFYILNLKGDLDKQIKVFKWISYRSFVQRISRMLEKDPQRIRIKHKDTYISPTNFFLHNFMVLTITASTAGYISYVESSEYKNPPIIISSLPSVILIEKKYSKRLFQLLSKSPNEKILCILNLIPTIPSEYKLMTESVIESNFDADIRKIWKDIFNLKKKNLFLYRLNIIGNLVKKPNMEWIEIFYLTHGFTYFLKIIVTKSLNVFSSRSDLILILKITKILMAIPEYESQIDESISELSSKAIPQMIQWMIKYCSNTEILLDILSIFKCFAFKNVELIENSQAFLELIKDTFFSSNAKVRMETLEILNTLSLHLHKKIVTILLPIAMNRRCQEFFELLKPVAQNTNDPKVLFKELVNVLYTYYKLPDNSSDGIIPILMFRPPNQVFSNGLFSILSILISRMKTIPHLMKYFNFLCDNILFNCIKFYEISNDLLNIITAIIKTKPDTASLLLPKLKQITLYSDYENPSSSSKVELSSTARSRGLKNLGATCYMNATIQQLFNIRELRERILTTHFSDNDWIIEFQYLFAELSFYPSKNVDPTPFVSKWTGWDGERVNPRDQQDAVEFLQMLLERLDEKEKGLTSMFRGQIIHSLVGRTEEYLNTSIEDFITLTLEVKDHKNVEESLKTFLIPDRFEGSNGYTVEGKGMIDADRYHKIRKSPDFLVIQLKRFEYNLSSNTRVKVNSEYMFPLELNLSIVMEKEPENENDELFELVGVLMHMGSAVAGHYFSHVKRGNGKWVTLNDLSISKCNGEELPIEAAGGKAKPRGNDFGFYSDFLEKDTNAYLLFYRKKSTISHAPDVFDTDFSISNFMNHHHNNTNSAFGSYLEFPKSSSVFSVNSMIEESEEDRSLIPNKKPKYIDSQCLERLVNDIHQTLARNIVTSDEFSCLLMELCSAEIDGEFLYSHFIYCLRRSYRKELEGSEIDENTYKLPFTLGNRIIFLFNNTSDLALYILSQLNHIDEFLFGAESEKVRTFYAKLLVNALNNSQNCGENSIFIDFSSYMKEKLYTIINHYKKFNQFFIVLCKLIEIESIEEWSEKIIEFISIAIPEYSNANKKEKVFHNIDLSYIFRIMNIMPIDFEFLSDNLLYWSFSKKHSFELINFISNRIQGNKNTTDIFLNIVKSNELSALQMSLFFVTNLKTDDKMNQMRDEIFNKTILKQLSYSEFLVNTTYRAKEFTSILKEHSSNSIFDFETEKIDNKESESECFSLSKRFMNFAPLFIKNFLFKTELNVITAFEKLVYAIFNENDKTSLFEFFSVLIENRSKIESFISKCSNDTNSPALAYFQILRWIIKLGNFHNEIFCYAKDFCFMLKKFNGSERKTSFYHLFNFIYDMFGENPNELFEKTPLPKFISSIPSHFCSVNDNSIKLVQLLMNVECEEFIKSDCFKSLCNSSFNDKEVGKNIRIFILKKVNVENSTKVCQILWDKHNFEKNVTFAYLEFLRLSWQLLRKYPKTANIFYDNSCHDFLWRKIHFDIRQIKKENNLRAKMKLFAIFNNSYIIENKDKKFFMKGSKRDHLVKHYTKDLSIPLNSIISACLFTSYSTNTYTNPNLLSPSQQIHNNNNNNNNQNDNTNHKSICNNNFCDKGYGKGGLFEFFKSMIKLDSFYLNEISHLFVHEKLSILAKCQIDSQISGAKFFAKLITTMMKKGLKGSENILIREFSGLSESLSSKFESIEILCELLHSGLLQDMKQENIQKIISSFNKIYKKTTEIKMFSSSIKKVALILPNSSSNDENAEKCERLSWCENVNKLISIQILNTSRKSEIEIENIRNLLNIGIDFINDCCTQYQLLKPKINVSRKQLNIIISKFRENEKMEFIETAEKLEKILLEKSNQQ